MAQRVSFSTGRASVESSTSELSEVPESLRGSNPSSVAYLVYANRGDPYSAGYKQPTTRDIPQIKLPRVEQLEDSTHLIEQAKRFAALNSDNSEVPDYTDLDKTAYESLKDDAVISHGTKPNKRVETEELLKETVPAIFYSENFKLDNPRVFDEVIGDGDSTVIQEKLSWYIDIVEAQLEREIAKSSTQFFTATSQFSQIQSQAATTSERITRFANLAEEQRKVMEYQHQTEQLRQKLSSAHQISEALNIVEKLSKLTQAAQSNPHNHEALINAQKFVEEQHSAGLDLSRVVVAQPFLDKLEAVEVLMQKTAAFNYASAMISELKADAATEGKSAHLLNGNAESSKALDIVDLLGARELACQLYADEVDRAVIKVVKSSMPSDRDTSPQPLARALHSLSPEEADRMHTTMFNQIIVLLEALARQIESSSSSNDPGRIKIHDESIIATAVRTADKQIFKVLRVRKDPVTSLSAPQFLQFASHVRDFCDASKKVSHGRAEATELYEFLVAQTKLYIHTMHTSAEEDLIQAMNADDWRRTEIKPSAQRNVDIIARSGLADTILDIQTIDETQVESSEAAGGSTSRVLLESDAYLVSRSTLYLVSLIIPYLQLSCNLPMQQLDNISTSLLELLRGYNNRLHHLILQFGATRTAGLRHISVKNLIFAFECLRFIEKLLTPIQQCFKRHIQGNPNQLGSAFDTVQQLFFDHRSEIKRRLVKLMSDKASAYARQIGTIDWSQPTSGKPNKYMVDLMRQTTTVANVAQEMLPPDIAIQIVQEIYSVYKPKLLETYSSVQVHTIEEKQNVLRDLAYFKQKSENLRGAGNTADVVYESVNGFVAPELPEVDQYLTVASTQEEISAPRQSLEVPEVPEADASIAYMSDDIVQTDDTENNDSLHSREISGSKSPSIEPPEIESATGTDFESDKVYSVTTSENVAVSQEFPNKIHPNEVAPQLNIKGEKNGFFDKATANKEETTKFAVDKIDSEKIELEKPQETKLEDDQVENHKDTANNYITERVPENIVSDVRTIPGDNEEAISGKGDQHQKLTLRTAEESDTIAEFTEPSTRSSNAVIPEAEKPYFKDNTNAASETAIAHTINDEKFNKPERPPSLGSSITITGDSTPSSNGQSNSVAKTKKSNKKKNKKNKKK